MLRQIFASLTLTCACLAVANTNASQSFASSEALLPTSFDIAHMAYNGQFTNWGIPASDMFCSDVSTTMLIGQDLAYAYLLESGYIDSLIAPTEGAIISQGQAQGQAQAKGQPLPTQQGQAQVKAKDVPVQQGQAQVKAKDVPVQQGQAQTKGKLMPSQQAQVKGKLFPSQQGHSQSGIITRTDLNIRRYVDYTHALTDDEVRLVRENFDEDFLRDLGLEMRTICGE